MSVWVVRYSTPSPQFGTTPCIRTRDLNGPLTYTTAAALADELAAKPWISNVHIGHSLTPEPAERAVPPDSEPTTSETVLAAFPELRDTDYGAYLDMLDREAERTLALFRADMARLKKEAGE